MSHSDVTALLGSDESDSSGICRMSCRCCTDHKKAWLFSCGGFWLLFALILGLVWPPLIRRVIDNELTLKEGTINYENWLETPIPMYLEITLFNLDNANEVQNGGKPKLSERGPYIFLEKHKRVDIKWNENDTVSFNQIRTWHFDSEKSNGTLDDEITFLNIISATAAYNVRNKNSIFKRVVDIMLKEEGGSFHVTKKVSEVLFDGYQDKLLDFMKKLHLPGIKIPFDKFGWFVDRNESSVYDGRFTMHTGADSIKKTGLLTRWNGSNTTGVYSGECSAVKGTTGELWPAEMDPETPKTVFITDVCRGIQLTKSENAEIHGIKGRKFTAGSDVFDNGDTFPDMKCFCTGDICPDLPAGVVNVSDCRFGAPVFASYPHFYLADPYYREKVDGMQPDAEKHGLTMTLETTTGIPLEVNARMQINMLLSKDEYISYYKNVEDVMVPLFWFRQYAELTDDFASKAKLVLVLPEIGLYVAYGLAGLGVILFLPAIFLCVFKR